MSLFSSKQQTFRTSSYEKKHSYISHYIYLLFFSFQDHIDKIEFFSLYLKSHTSRTSYFIFINFFSYIYFHTFININISVNMDQMNLAILFCTCLFLHIISIVENLFITLYKQSYRLETCFSLLKIFITRFVIFRIRFYI